MRRMVTRNVAPREGRVSRNNFHNPTVSSLIVAPREGRVSRNNNAPPTFRGGIVAPREGRVSRNMFVYGISIYI